MVWVLIVLFSGVDIELVVSNADTAWELVFQILCRSEVLELKKVVSGKLGKSPLATTLSAVRISRILLVTVSSFEEGGVTLSPQTLTHSCKVDRTCRLPIPASGLLLSPAAIQALYSEESPPCLHLAISTEQLEPTGTDT